MLSIHKTDAHQIEHSINIIKSNVIYLQDCCVKLSVQHQEVFELIERLNSLQMT